MQFGFIHTDHLSSPISNLLLGHCRRRQQSTTSIFNLRSHIWGGWLGARIYNLHSPSPISTFWPCCCSERSAIHNLNLRSLVLNGEPDRTDLLARLGRVRVRDPLGSPVLIYYLYPNDLLVLRRDVHYSSATPLSDFLTTDEPGGHAGDAQLSQGIGALAWGPGPARTVSGVKIQYVKVA